MGLFNRKPKTEAKKKADDYPDYGDYLVAKREQEQPKEKEGVE